MNQEIDIMLDDDSVYLGVVFDIWQFCFEFIRIAIIHAISEN